MTKVSIVVPIYNVEQYLPDCLESLLHQSLSGIEVLLVNDGTEDGSDIIAKEYAGRYPEMFFYYEKENGGLSDARNFAMPYVSGQYLAFVDSDDWVDPSMFEKLYKKAVEDNADIVDCEFEYVYEDNGKHRRVEFPKYKSKYDCLIQAYPNAWNKLYRTEWLKSLNIQFPKGLWHEDIEFFFKIIPFANKVPSTIHEPLYFYRQRSGSIMSNPDRRILDLHKIYNHIISFYKEKEIYDEYKETIEYKYLKTTCCNFLRRMLKIKDYRIKSEIIDESWRLFSNKCPNWRENSFLKNISWVNVYLKLMSQSTLNIMKLIIK